jgi:Cys-rich protein (TIGR01571 family)
MSMQRTNSDLCPPVGPPCLLQIHTRTEARERYGIRGDTYNDCLTAWLCRPCSLTQERREIELEEGSFESDQPKDQSNQ